MNKKTLSILLAFLLILLSTERIHAQVTIGSKYKPIAGALLDLKEKAITDGAENSSKGLLLPRVELSKLKPLNGKLSESIGNIGTWDEKEHIGLMVYNAINTFDACTGGAFEGVYSWDGEQWLPLYQKTIMPDANDKSSDSFDGANSYIVKTNSSVKIPIKRAYEIWNAYTGSNPANGQVLNIADANIVGGIPNVQIAWQDDNTISTTNIEGTDENANLVVKTGINEGNALIKVLLNDKVLWQWHIWISNHNPLENTSIHSVNGETDWYMNRFLGANSIADVGLYYQWGRNVPMQKDGSIAFIDGTATERENLTNAIQSEKFIVFNSTSSHDWYSATPKQWDVRWGDLNNGNTKKSPFDPCPYGWRLPSIQEDISPWECVGNEENTQDLRNATLSGYRANGDGSLGDVGKAGYVWTASPNSAMAGMLYYNASQIDQWDAFNRANGMNVRCLRDKIITL